MIIPRAPILRFFSEQAYGAQPSRFAFCWQSSAAYVFASLPSAFSVFTVFTVFTAFTESSSSFLKTSLSLSFFSRALLSRYYYYNYYYNYYYYYYYLEGDARGSYGRITGKAFAMLYMRDCVVNV